MSLISALISIYVLNVKLVFMVSLYVTMSVLPVVKRVVLMRTIVLAALTNWDHYLIVYVSIPTFKMNPWIVRNATTHAPHVGGEVQINVATVM